MFKILRWMLASFWILLSSQAMSLEGIKPETATKDVHVMTEKVSVDLDIFSGLPNPQWFLSSTEAKEFYTILSSLPKLEHIPPATPSLGFRGVIIRNEADSSYVIYKGYVWSLAAGTTTIQQDADQVLRAWLLKTSQAHLPADLYELLVKESEPKQLF